MAAPFPNLAVLSKDTIHRADRAVVDAFIEQRRVDFRRGQIGKAGRAEQIEHTLPRPGLQCARRAGSGFREERRPRSTPYAALQAGARDAERGAAGRYRAQFGQRCGERLGQAALLRPIGGGIGGSSSPSRSASFFWSSMIASARSRRRRSCAFSRWEAVSLADSGLVSAAMNCEATSIRLIKVDNDDLSPLVQRGSYGLLSLDQNSFNGKGFYAVFAALGVEVWLLSSQRGDEILLSRRNPSDLNSYIELNLDAEGIEILGKILWFISPSEAALVGVAAP